MRERVIAEIRRLAAASGGRPPGRQVFEAETGIRFAEWYGIHWARWGDALAEAGFSPNELKGKFDRDELLKHLAGAVRHFQRVPTYGDLRLYGRSQPQFPSHSTISNHFKGKSDLVEALRSWSSKNSDFADVISLLPQPAASSPSRTLKPKEGSVYLIQAGQYFKVGRSEELERRVKEIRVALPDAAILVHTIMTDDPAGIEAYWHRRFADRRANGEWFKLVPSDVLAFKRRKFQ